MFWFRLRASFIGRRVVLWSAGGCAILVLAGYVIAGLLPASSVGMVALNVLMFGMFHAGNHNNYGFLPILDVFPGATLGAAVLVVAFVGPQEDPTYATFVCMLGGMVGSIAWAFLPIEPTASPEHVRRIVERLGDFALDVGAPITTVVFHSEMTLVSSAHRGRPILRLRAKGPTTLYEEPRWNTPRALCERPTLLPVVLPHVLDPSEDDVAWRLPTSAHAKLAHAARVANSHARSVFGPS